LIRRVLDGHHTVVVPKERVGRINDDRAGQPIAINLGEWRDGRVRDRQDQVTGQRRPDRPGADYGDPVRQSR
jgi:hypothetical protein